MNATGPSSPVRCDGVVRRDFLHVGLMSAFGLSLADVLRLQAAPAGRVKSCILIWLDGGPSHLDTFDPKPDAPVEIRGPFKAIGTDVDGIQLSEHLRESARVMKHVALVRSLTHELGNHDTGSHYLLTGHRPTPALQYPSLGSIVARESGDGTALPPYVTVPDSVPSLRAGCLPAAFGPFAIAGDPSKPDYRVRDLQPPEWLSFERLGQRREMQRQLDQFARSIEESGDSLARDRFFEQAHQLIASPSARAAFDLEQESPQTRQRYGQRRIGAGCLLARRLVEAGTRFVTVVDRGWDTHQDIARTLPDAQFPGSGKVPDMDRAFAALITDLNERGLLDSTLVVMMGEFGRTPKINSRAGRDHWPRAGFACFAGGGVRGGQVIGRTDEHGETPEERPVRPEDIAQSILTLLGVDTTDEYQTPAGRPMKILTSGEFVSELT
ncbi:MAG: DUF1501 domain-containing protein [Prosthecobacter sp.]